jgi:DNA-binding response OmpR family regulator
VLLTSGFDETDLGAQATGVMANGYIHKPFDAEELRDKVAAALLARKR